MAIDGTKMTLIPKSSSVNTAAVGSQTVLSQYDIRSLNKAYSCAGRVATYGGGYSQVLHYSHLLYVLRLFITKAVPPRVPHFQRGTCQYLISYTGTCVGTCLGYGRVPV